jgi:hypothetical protein
MIAIFLWRTYYSHDMRKNGIIILFFYKEVLPKDFRLLGRPTKVLLQIMLSGRSMIVFSRRNRENWNRGNLA